MNDKVVLIGEAPNPATAGLPGLWLRPDSSGRPHSANRLLEFTGYTQREYLELFERTNLVKRPVRSWPRREAREAADAMRPALFNKDVVLLGGKVAEAFGAKDYELFLWIESDCYPAAGRFRMIRVPHPSGLNRWWNDEANRQFARRFFQDLLARQLSGSAAKQPPA